ncbi:MAG: signal peptide peptidase SppA [Acidobacteriota bacterium]|nr:signal peptide peptidase SppA [Acidobacteriota bacterium]
MFIRRGVRFILTLFMAAVIVSSVTMVVVYFLLSRGPSVPRNATLVLRVPSVLTEVNAGGLLGQVLGAPPTVRSIVDNLHKAAVDDRVSRVVLLPRGGQALWGKIQEVRDAVMAFKSSGKPVVAYLEYGGDQQYYLATAADRIFLMPTSPLDLMGVASYELFLRGTFDLIGVYPDFLHAGDYKTAGNLFTEETFTQPHREMSESLNADLFDQLVLDIATSRSRPASEIRALIAEGPFLPEDALAAGLVDELAYEDEVLARDAEEQQPISGQDYAKVSLRSVGLNTGPKIAVIHVAGVINTGRSGYNSTQGSVVGSDTVIENLREARNDSTVRAIVLRIDSPGGSAIASDVIWREVVLTRADTPVIASMSDVAASGGYYIAMPAQAIVAQPATLTGSIGVVAGKFVVGEAFSKLGANIESVSQGRFAEINSPVRAFSAAERAKVQVQLDAVYETFVRKAAEGRAMTLERIHAVAQGRVWTGRQGQQMGLVDELGSLDHAVAIAKQYADIEPETDVELVIYPPARGLLETLRRPLASVHNSLLAPLFSSTEMHVLNALSAPLRLFNRGEALTLMPNVFLP